MIILENGDKWIIDDEELDNLDYDEACKGNVPFTDIKDFVERVCENHRHDNKNKGLLTPRKLTFTEDEEGGYWDCNFDVFKEVLGSVAVAVISNPWSTVYKMPWNDVIVVFTQSAGCDAETVTKKYNCYTNYLLDALLPQ